MTRGARGLVLLGRLKIVECAQTERNYEGRANLANLDPRLLTVDFTLFEMWLENAEIDRARDMSADTEKIKVDLSVLSNCSTINFSMDRVYTKPEIIEERRKLFMTVKMDGVPPELLNSCAYYGAHIIDAKLTDPDLLCQFQKLLVTSLAVHNDARAMELRQINERKERFAFTEMMRVWLSVTASLDELNAIANEYKMEIPTDCADLPRFIAENCSRERFAAIVCRFSPCSKMTPLFKSTPFGMKAS
jgi:hypothetical protein